MDEQRAQRRLTMMSRQMTLAKIAKREAMVSLADAVTQEARSAHLSQRSRGLLSEYSKRLAAKSGHDLQGNAKFVHQLQEVAEQAAKALNDASDQARWQVQSLAKAESRASRFSERIDAAKRDIESIKAKRETAQTGQMARKLHSISSNIPDT